MAAGRARSSRFPVAGSRSTVDVSRLRGGVARKVLQAAVSAALAASVAGCGQSVKADLPDLATKQAPLPGGSKVLSSAEQKQAVDRMIAKREAMEKELPK